MATNHHTYFISGIGTEVGKTVASAIVCKALQAAYWKPIQTGYLGGKGDRDAATVSALTDCQYYPEAYLFEQPLSPHAAAVIDGKKVEMERIIPPQHEGPLVIEGAGGLMVPLNESSLFIDLMEKWKISVILVVRHYLGNINHTLLSIEALKSRSIPIKGMIVMGSELPDTMEAIKTFGDIPVLLEVPELETINPQVIEMYAQRLKL